MSVGEFIEGYSDAEDQIRAWWQEIHDALSTLSAPFFAHDPPLSVRPQQLGHVSKALNGASYVPEFLSTA